MRVLRSSLYTEMDKPPTIAVVRDCDLSDTLESTRLSVTEASNRQGALVLTDIFQLSPGSSLEYAIHRAGQRSREFQRREQNQARLYFYIVHTWAKLRPGGTMLGDRPSPLTTDEMRAVFEQLARHPDYNDYSFIYPDKDGLIVTLQRGKLADRP